MQFLQRPMNVSQRHWVRRMEHIVLRVVSLGFSLASAHAIRWFFAPLDGVDALQPTITWVIALGFGLLGYFVSRGLAHRLMNHERIRAYAPICLVVEVVEIFCNYALAAAVIQRATWLQAVPAAQRSLLTAFTYVVLSIIPLVSLLLAVVDMDMERSKQGAAVGGGFSLFGANRFGNNGAKPKVPTYSPGTGSPAMSVPYPPQAQGYNGNGYTMPPLEPKGTAVPFAAGRPTTVMGSSGIP
jgi:hypothetical protein